MDRNPEYHLQESYQGLNGQDVWTYSYNYMSGSGVQNVSSLPWHLPPASEYYQPNYLNCTNSVDSVRPVLHSAHVEASSFTCVSGTRVHINPNFRPKASGPLEKNMGSNRLGSVHINPHWKRKSDLPMTESNESDAGNVGRKTIFVNPKMLSAFHPIQPMLSIGSGDVTSVPMPLPISTEVDKSASQDDLLGSLPFSAASRSGYGANNSECKSKLSTVFSTVKNSSKKLSHLKELKDETFVCNTVSAGKHPYSSNLCLKNDANSHPVSFMVSSKLRTAKQISSKYKFVRNASKQSNTSSPMKIVPVNPWRRIRKKSASLKPTNAAFSKSSKYFEFNRSITKLSSRYKLVNKSRACHLQNPGYISNSKAVLPQRLRKNSFGNKVLKTQYKFVKMPSPSLIGKRVAPMANNDGRLRNLNTRFKLVQGNNTSAPPKLRPTLRTSTLPLLKSHLKLQRYTSHGMNSSLIKVSRYRVIHSHGSRFKMKVQQPSALKWTRHFRPASLYQYSQVKESWPYFYGNRIWRNRMLLQSSTILRNKYKLLRLHSGSPKQSSPSVTATRSGSNVLSIGGVIYRSTPTSLTRAQPCGASEQVLHIRGQKFVLDSKKTTLRLMVDTHVSKLNSQAPMSRIDIGGVTYVRRSGNTFVRTNTHYARSLLSFAKMKSIALLTAKLRKNNQPCLIYNRFGKCLAHEKGKCWRVHNPNNVSICRKFLQGCCDIAGCLLSHNVGPEKMPTCKYFLEGCCVRDNCPYLHVKLSAQAAICRQFLDGFCAAGDMCKKRHVNICPNFDRDGKCLRGKYCPYPHPKVRKIKARHKKTSSYASSSKESNKSYTEEARTNSNLEVDGCKNPVCKERKRYYDGSKLSITNLPESDQRKFTTALKEKRHRILKQIDHLKKMRHGMLIDTDTTDSSDSEVDEEQLPDVNEVRPKIGILPAYIPLE